MPITECDGRLFKEALLGSLAWLTINRDEVDALNVFPVPDGDTGTNMLLTLQSAVEDIRGLDEPNLSAMAKRASHGALMGARGNSGVILSQIFRGFSMGIGSAASVDAKGLARAFREGADVAYRAVIRPTEGTMLPVAREAAAGAEAEAAQSTGLTRVVRAACEAAATAVERTPEQLPILKQAGVIDAGGFGLQLILDGFLKRMLGEELATFERPATQHARPKEVQAPSEGWGYCTEFIINGEKLPVDDVRKEIQRQGDSALVVGDDSAINGNVIMTAQQVAELSKKRVRVVPSRSLPQGIAALFAFDFSANLEANANAMSHALGQVQTIEVTRAVWASEVDGLKIAENDVIGLLNDRIVDAGASPETVVQSVLKRIDAGNVGTVTIYAGADAPETEREALCTAIAKQFPKASIELQSGEQALYPYVVAVE